ncbi:MAG: SRPBCC family protein [Phycisphaerales bacterium]
MSSITVTETVHAPIERVFEIASNIPNAANSIRGIELIETLEEAPPADNNNGPVGLGYTWRETRIMFGKEATEDMSITKWSPPNSYTVEARSHGCHYLTELTFKSNSADSNSDDHAQPVTTITMSFNATPETMGAKIMMFIFSFMTKKLVNCLADDLRDIKAAAEAD